MIAPHPTTVAQFSLSFPVLTFSNKQILDWLLGRVTHRYPHIHFRPDQNADLFHQWQQTLAPWHSVRCVMEFNFLPACIYILIQNISQSIKFNANFSLKFLVRRNKTVEMSYICDQHINPLAAKLFNWNFHSLEVVSRWRDPKLWGIENY